MSHARHSQPGRLCANLVNQSVHRHIIAHISHTSCRAYCLEDIPKLCFVNSGAFTLLCSVRQMLALIKRLFHTLFQSLIQTQYTEPQISNSVCVLVCPAMRHVCLFCFCLRTNEFLYAALPLPLQHSCCRTFTFNWCDSFLLRCHGNETLSHFPLSA